VAATRIRGGIRVPSMRMRHTAAALQEDARNGPFYQLLIG